MRVFRNGEDGEGAEAWVAERVESQELGGPLGHARVGRTMLGHSPAFKKSGTAKPQGSNLVQLKYEELLQFQKALDMCQVQVRPRATERAPRVL